MRMLRPALVRVLLFQDASLAPILSTKNWRVFLLGFFEERGNPRYLPRSEVAVTIPHLHLISIYRKHYHPKSNISKYICMKMGILLCFIFLFFSSASAACNQCVLSKASFFSSNNGLSAGACGYGSIALDYYGGHVAAALPSIYSNGEKCGACFQMRCKNSAICTTKGTTIVVTDVHTDKSNTTDFVLSNRAFRAMALPGKDTQLLRVGIADVEYKRVPCVYKGKNLAIQVEKFSKFPNFLAVKVLYQGGQTSILGGDVASVDHPSNWVSLSRNYGAVFDTNNAPSGKLMLRFIINSGFDAQFVYVNEALPANWKPGVIYNTSVQINNVALTGCAPCTTWK